MLINGIELSEPEIRAYIKQLETACKQTEDENKELKRLLKLAVDTFTQLEVDCQFFNNCDRCPIYNKEYDFCEWKYRKEALKLIGDEEDA